MRNCPLCLPLQTLAAASVDSNSLLGNVDLSYKYHFYDGAVIPIVSLTKVVRSIMFRNPY